MTNYTCTICGYICDEKSSIVFCPFCGSKGNDKPEINVNLEEDLQYFTLVEMSTLCSHLAEGFKEQNLHAEADFYGQLAEYFQRKMMNDKLIDFTGLVVKINQNINKTFALTYTVSMQYQTSLNTLTWSEKVSRILNSLLKYYEKKHMAFAGNMDIYICEICAYIHVGDHVPDICPVCKVPHLKIIKQN